MTAYNCENTYETFKTLPITWYELCMRADGHQYSSPNYWIVDLDTLTKDRFIISDEWIEDQIHKKELCMNYNECKVKNTHMVGHPSVKGHELWKKYLIANLDYHHLI